MYAHRIYAHRKQIQIWNPYDLSFSHAIFSFYSTPFHSLAVVPQRTSLLTTPTVVLLLYLNVAWYLLCSFKIPSIGCNAFLAACFYNYRIPLLSMDWSSWPNLWYNSPFIFWFSNILNRKQSVCFNTRKDHYFLDKEMSWSATIYRVRLLKRSVS